MTRSIVALIAAVGCWGAEPSRGDPLLGVRRIFVERLAGERSSPVRDMIVNALQNSKIFQLTEDAEKADATLRGSADDQVFSEMHQSSEGIHAGGSIGSGNIGSKATVPRLSATVGDRESSRSVERRHEASAAVRLVGKDGDVIWSTTQESGGAKFRGAGADVADKVVRQLLADLERARRASNPPPSGGKQ